MTTALGATRPIAEDEAGALGLPWPQPAGNPFSIRAYDPATDGPLPKARKRRKSKAD